MKRETSALTSRPSALRRAVGGLVQVLGGLARALVRDKFTLFLIVATVSLTVAFFSLLGDTRPSSPGNEVPLSVTLVTSEQKGIVKATLLDEDARVVSETSDGRLLWSAYPHSDAQTTALIRTLRGNGAVVGV